MFGNQYLLLQSLAALAFLAFLFEEDNTYANLYTVYFCSYSNTAMNVHK